MNCLKLLFDYKDSSKSGTLLIPFDDVSSALSVETIGSYFASEDYRHLNESIDFVYHSNNNNTKRNNESQTIDSISDHQINIDPLSPVQQKKLLNSMNNNRNVNEEDILKYSQLIEMISENLLPEYKSELENKMFLRKVISTKLLDCEKLSIIIEQILIDAKDDYKQALKESIVDYLLMNEKVRNRFGIKNSKIRFIHTISRSIVPWRQSIKEVKSFHEQQNYICHPIIIEMMKIWDKHYRTIEIYNFNANEILSSDQFKSIITRNCQKMNYMLKFEWVSACSQVILNMFPNLIGLDSVKNESLFNTISAFMSRLMRQLILNNIDKWTNMLSNHSIKSKPLFNISIECKSFGSPHFVPLINKWKELLTYPIYEILRANRDIMRIEDQLILMKPKNFYVKQIVSVEENDFEVEFYLRKIFDILDKEMVCHSIIDHYEREFSLKVFESNTEQKDKFLETNELIKIIRRSESILKNLIFQSNHFEFGIFQIDCRNLNDYIKNQITNRINKFIETKVIQILSLTQLICDNFLNIEQNINKQSDSTSALVDQIKQFEEYKSNVNLMLYDIEYVENHWIFVVEEGSHFLNDADFELFHKLYNWPKRIKTTFAENEKRFNSCKLEVETQLKLRIVSFENKLHELEKVVDDFKQKRLSSPIECISDNCNLLNDIENELNKAIIEAKDINNEEKLLGLESTSNFSLLTELIERKVPLDKIWKTANIFQERETEWMAKPMCELNVTQLRETVNELLSTSIEMSESFKSKSIDLIQNANTLKIKINSFKQKYVPLLQVLSNPVLKDKHWIRLSEILGQEITADSFRTLIDVISITNVTQYLNEIESLGNIAMKEHALEVFLERMKTEWLEEWPKDALEIAAEKFLEGESLETQLKQKCVNAFKYIHEDCRLFISFNKTNKSELKFYVTPPLFLELILTFKDLLKKKQKHVCSQRNRYLKGVEKLDSAANHVEMMRNKLINEFQPLLLVASEETEKLMIKIEKETLEIETKKEIIAADEAVANKSAAFSQQIKDECTKELAHAIPAIECAIEALNTLKSDDITFLRTMKNPPSGVKMLLEAVCILKGVQPERRANPNGLGGLVDDYWNPSLRMLKSEIKFLDNLKSFDRNNIARDSIALVRERYLHCSEFDPTLLRKVSIACEGLAKWVKAIDIYDRVINVVKPKREKLINAEQELEYVMEELEIKKNELQLTSDKLQQLNDEFAHMLKKKKELEENIDFCSLKLKRAEQLIKGLDVEKKRWKEVADLLTIHDENVVGDVLLSAATIVYTSALNASDRYLCLNKWHHFLKNQYKLSFTEPFSIINTLGIPNEMQIWSMAGLSSDQFSTENAIIAENSKRFPFIINPNQLVNKWIKCLYPNVIQIDYQNVNEENSKEVLFKAIKGGEVVLIENVDTHELHPFLISLIEKEIVIKDGLQFIKFENHWTEYSNAFKLYICSKLLLHLSPITSSRVNLINWCTNTETLTINIDSERALLMQTRAEKEKQLIKLEDQILQVLSTAETNVLEDENAIKLLVTYKSLAQQIECFGK